MRPTTAKPRPPVQKAKKKKERTFSATRKENTQMNSFTQQRLSTGFKTYKAPKPKAKKNRKSVSKKPKSPEFNAMVGELEHIVEEAKSKFREVGGIDNRTEDKASLYATKQKYEQMLQDTMQDMVQKLKKVEKQKTLADKNAQRALKSEQI